MAKTYLVSSASQLSVDIVLTILSRFGNKLVWNAAAL